MLTDQERQEMRDYDDYMIAKNKAELEEQPMFWPFFFFALPLSYLVCWFASWVDRDTEHFRVTGWDYLWAPPLIAPRHSIYDVGYHQTWRVTSVCAVKENSMLPDNKLTAYRRREERRDREMERLRNTTDTKTVIHFLRQRATLYFQVAEMLDPQERDRQLFFTF